MRYIEKLEWSFGLKKVPIIKYTSCGNNFVIIDEIKRPLLSESEKSQFAVPATNRNFGIGSDNFLVIQPCNHQTLHKINATRNYWRDIPDCESADYIFRMFESDGTEAYSCGNGLMSVANYLYHRYQRNSAKIMTEIPTGVPRVVEIGSETDEKTNWAKMAKPRRMSEKMVDFSICRPLNDTIDFVPDVPINKIRQSDGRRFFDDSDSLSISGYLVFTGEPHFVIFADQNPSISAIANELFPISAKENQTIDSTEKRKSNGSAFVEFMGNYFVREFSHLFPVGINLNFARIVDKRKIIENRTFERGINIETLACGTGALAVAYVARVLDLVNSNQITVWPQRCRWEEQNAEIKVEECLDGWLLKSKPLMLLEGSFVWH